MNTKARFEKLWNPMTGKCWTFLLAAGAASVMVMIALINFVIDPYNYFRSAAAEGEVYSVPEKTYNPRLYKYEYFKAHAADYEGVILGGSKGSRVSERHLSELDGIPYYNLTAEYGNFSDYLAWVRWLTEYTDIEKIFLNISTLEVHAYSGKEWGMEAQGYYLPAAVSKERSELTEFVQNLYRGGIQICLDYLKGKRDGTLWVYSMGNINEADMYVGIESRKGNLRAMLNDMSEKLFDGLELAAEGEFRTMPAMERNLKALEEIKELCDNAGVDLTVVVASTYVSQYLRYESPEYWEYLRDMAEITDYWDFAFLNSYNRNPYNFLDANHAYGQTLNRMLNQIYGKENLEDFGVYVTADNVDEHIEKRKSRFYDLLAEYEETGTIQLGKAYDESYLMNDLIFPALSNMFNLQTSLPPLKDYLYITQHFYAGFGRLQGVGIYANGLLEDMNARGTLHLEIYDDIGKHTIYTTDIDTKDMVNAQEYILTFPDLELIEGHWYSLIFSYKPATEDDSFGLQFVDGSTTERIYADLDSVVIGEEARMNIYGLQTPGLCETGTVRLQLDEMRGEGEGHTLAVSNTDRYTQFFTADACRLSYIQLQTFREDMEPEAQPETAYNVTFELWDTQGNRMGRKTVMGSLLCNTDLYNVVLDGDIYLKDGEVYELVIYSDMTPEQGLMLMTHAEDRMQGSTLYRNGKTTGESLCYRIYGVAEQGSPVAESGDD